ncbi:hypothetical protein [Gordonibacter sp. Marseille-P4307]|uniref:hypothetical protein n=1 Tax=Gordonibacter sp. Marseille-P4307 TaxID=2161815 RepID=UPI000F541E1C|nr:hypothetical protein [Gordonibacter sp. Marseille-P4307]
MSEMIRRAEWDHIKRDYAFRKNDSDFEMPDGCAEHHDRQKVYCEGCDSKYGTIMVSREMCAWRHPTFDEFYDGAVID